MTEQEVLDLLLQAKGFDIRLYDDSLPKAQRPRKSLERLYQEHAIDKLPLILNSAGLAVFKKSCARLFIYTPQWVLYEIGRRYENNDEMVWKKEGHANSETVRKDEPVYNGALHCLQEELDIFDTEIQLQLQPSSLPTEIKFYRSTVYPGVWCNTTVSYFHLPLNERMRIERPIIRDSGTTVHQKWFPRLETGIQEL